MNNKTYPIRNPFPYQGTRSLEGTEAENDETSGRWPTFETRPVKEAVRIATRYVQTDESQLQGIPLAFVGAHGSGKTHAIFFAWKQLQQRAVTTLQPHRQPYWIYVKAEGPDFPLLYREITKGISLTMFRELAERFLASVAGRQAGRDLQDKTGAESLKDKLREDPSLVARLFATYVVEESAVQASQASEVIQIAGGRLDFQHALSFLLSDYLAETAHSWFLGHKISVDDARKLGVSCLIDSPDMAKWALQLIVMLFRRADRPFILCIDQFEKLVLDNEELVSQNAGLLHSLLEVIPREKGFFILSGNDVAWLKLPPDLRQRFSDNVVQFPILTLDEAKLIVEVYLQSVASGDGTTTSGSTGPLTIDLWPFDEGAVREILRYGGGNIRRLLQICSGLFDEACSEHRAIDVAFTANVLQRRTQMGFDESVIGLEIERVLAQRGVRFTREFRVNAAQIDFAALEADGTPRFFVQINSAIFHNDEARRAQESLQLALRIHGSAAPTPLVLVIAGYISPEVLSTVQNIAQEVVVYRPDSFAERFGQVIERLQKASPPRSVNPKERERIDQQFAELKAHLEKLVRIRDEEARTTNERVAEVLRQQERSREQESREQARRDWAQERARLEERITVARAERGTRHFEEMENVCESAQKVLNDRLKRRTLILAVPVAICLIISGTWLLLQHNLFLPRNFSSPSTILTSWIPLVAGFLMLFLSVRADLLGSFLPGFAFYAMHDEAARFKELAGPFRSLDQLKNAALSASDEKYRRFNSQRMLFSKNPHLRFAALLDRKRGFDQSQLLDMLRREPCSVLRRFLAQALGELYDDSYIDQREAISDLLASVPEMIYCIEVIARKGQFDSFPKMRMTNSHRLVANLTGERTGVEGVSERHERDSIACELVFALVHKPFSERSKALLRAFETDLDAPTQPELESISPQQVRQSVRELSPFDEGGLGTFDELQSIDTVEQLYLFFRQLQFLKDRGFLSGDKEGHP